MLTKTLLGIPTSVHMTVLKPSTLMIAIAFHLLSANGDVHKEP